MEIRPVMRSIAVAGWRPLAIALAVSVFIVPGCRGPKIRDRHLHRAGVIERLTPSKQTSLPSSYVVGGSAADSYEYLRMRVEGDGHDHPAALLEVAEMASSIGRNQQRRDPISALIWHRDAAAYASFCLAAVPPEDDSSETNKLRDRALDLHNRSVVQFLRCAGAREGARSDWRGALDAVQVVPVNTTARRRSVEWDELWLADDYKVKGLKPLLKRDGLGVTLVAYKAYPDRNALPDRFYPAESRLPATAVLAPQGELAGGAWRENPVRLDLHDPLEEDVAVIGNGSYRLAHDLTTPLAHQVLRSHLEQMERIGLIDPERLVDATGIYFAEPYERGKVPVLFIHGLTASPRCWLPMFHAVQADPELRDRYQFLFAYYPTGEPLLYSTMLLRRSLEQARATFDPDHTDAAWDRMVVVGHSLGAVTARTLTQSSDETVEGAIFRVPTEQVVMKPEVRALIHEATHFEPHPAISRLVLICGPFKGSWIANRGLGRFTSRIIKRPRNITEAFQDIRDENGPEVLQPMYQRHVASSVDNLMFDSPILHALSTLPMAPGVSYHTIAGNIRPNAPMHRWGDLVVPYTSAHLDGAESEIIINRTHFCSGSPEVIHETLRVLRLHEAIDPNAVYTSEQASFVIPAIEQVDPDAIVIEPQVVPQVSDPERAGTWRAVNLSPQRGPR